MRYPRKWQLAVVCLLVLALLPFAPAPHGTAQAPGYTVTDLGTLGGDASRAFGLNECGRVVGEAQATPTPTAPFRPFLWNDANNNGQTDAGEMQDLGTLGGTAGTAYAVNQTGTTVGSALTSGGLLHPFTRPLGGPSQDLGTLGGFTAEAQDVNASGQVVGESEDGALQDRAFIWQAGVGMKALTAPFGTPIRAFGINDAGQIAGSANLSTSGTHAFVTIGGVAKDLGTLGGNVSVATEVNDTGAVAGYSYIFSPDITQFFHAFYWKDANNNGQSDAGEMHDLGVLGSDKNSYAFDLNNSDVVVGYSENIKPDNSIVKRAFIWTNATGLQDLNTVASGTGWTFEEARGINNRGQIVGTGRNPDGKLHAYLLTPINVGPSPCDATPTPTPTPVPGALQFSAPTYTVGEGGGSVVISVSRTGGSDGAVSVSYATSNGTATAGNDYTAASGTLNFGAGETTKTFSVDINDDALDEADETVNLTLSSPGGGATLGAQSTAVLTIIDNEDAAPTVSVSDAPAVTEGNSGTTNATFTVSLSAASGQTVTVNYATADGTATQPGDYTPASGTVTFDPGQTSKNVTVAVVGDTLDETNESFNLNLSSPTNATINDGTGVGTIIDDDGAPALSIKGVTVTEGNSGTTTATFTVSLLPASGQTVTVNYATADGTATQPSDYTSKSGTLTFAPGQTSQQVSVSVNGDEYFEPDETFSVNLSAPSNATIADAQGLGTITNDEPLSTFEFVSAAYSVRENGVFVNVVVKRTGSTAGLASVNYATSDGTANSLDYMFTSGTLTFSVGEPAIAFNIPVKTDSLFEGDETFNVTLSSPFGGVVGPQGTTVVTIQDDNTQPTLGFDASLFISPENSGTATITVRRSGGVNGGVTIDYATSNGTATAGSDYTATQGTLTFLNNEITKTFTVPLINDALDEPLETVNLTLSNPGGGAALDPTATTAVLRIQDDDPPPALSVNDVTVTEGNSGTTNATFTVSLSAASGQAVAVNFATADGTATQPGDYTSNSGTLNFAPGETSKTVNVSVNGDTSNEANETFFVNLSGASNATVSDAQGQGTINNDDTPTLRFSQATYPTGESSHFVTVTVTRGGDSAPAVAVNFATADGTATERRDYTAVSGRLQFAAGETSKTFDVLLTEDAYTESEETINLTLSNPTGGAALGGQSTATVNLAADDNPPPGTNPIDVSSDFVRQHYHDFLNREPDAPGLAFWTGEIEQCGANAGCREVKRINVSAAFFLSIEFQQTGYLVYRTYKVAYGDATSPNVAGTVPVVRLQEFLPDTRIIGDGVVVGPQGWEQKLEANKQAYMAEFVQRSRFLTAFPNTLTAAAFVDKLNQNAGGVLTQAERDNLVAALAPDPTSVSARAAALRSVAENNALQQNELRRAFVLMQYYGYLRRNPDDTPDTDFRGWAFWLGKLNDFNGNYVKAEMVKAFLDSIEYRTRFAP